MMDSDKKESETTATNGEVTVNGAQYLDFSQLDTVNDKEANLYFGNQKESKYKEEDNFYTPLDVTLASPTDAEVKEPEYEAPQAGPSTTRMESDALTQSVETGMEDGVNENEEPKTVDILTIENNEDESNQEEQTEEIREELQVTATIEKTPNAEETGDGPGPEKNAEDGEAVAGANTNGGEEIAAEGAVTETTSEEKQAVVENQAEDQDSTPADAAAAPTINQSEPEALALAPNQEDKDKKKPSKKKDFKITVPQPFRFHEGRPKADNADKGPEYKFKARPVPKNVLEGPKDVKIKANLKKLTQPSEPNLKSDERARTRNEKKELAPAVSADDASGKASTHASTNSINKIKSLKPPTPKKVFPPSPPTKIKPFSFAERDRELQKKKQMKLQQEKLEQDIKTFKFVAKPVPSFRSKLTKKPESESNVKITGKGGKENKNQAKPTGVNVKKPLNAVENGATGTEVEVNGEGPEPKMNGDINGH